MRGGFVRFGLCLAALIWAGTVPAAVVHVVTQQSLDGGEPTVLADVTQETGGDYRTAAAPAVAGYVFTHWTSSDANGFTPRDVFGRAYEQAKYHLYQKLTLTANYLPESRDTDRDGVADGWEIYWYGNLTKNAASDTDGDGYTFAQELAAGTNPLMNDRAIVGGVVKLDSEEWLYNPNDYPLVTIRSEPEGVLCPTTIEVVAPGTVKTTANLLSTGKFAYWKLNGVRQADAFGRARDTVCFTMTRENVVLTAVAAEDEETRQKLYWYGTTSVALTSDTDGDGFTFAEELAAGTSPVMPNRTLMAGVTWRDSDEWMYNPKQYCKYVIRSEPEGALFETQADIVAPGTAVVTPSVSKAAGFAYWALNGVRQADPFGRALDTVRLTAAGETIELVAWTEPDAEAREQLYWYGRVMDLNSDTDGDGYTFAEEIAAGTNPLLPDRAINGGVVWRDAEDAEMNLQPYEKIGGAVVGERYETWGDFGGAVKPVAADVNGDGLWDLVVCTATATNVYINVGSKGSPEFRRGGALASSMDVDLNMNSTDKLASMGLDVAPINALSATTWKDTMLVSDAEGRIWYYLLGDAAGEDAPRYGALQHKVWGGSHPGFAEGLQLAAVDWEDDGDLDCLCGTADGKLMLLRDPKVGRPTNLKASTGVNSVVLRWDPNAQSRIRGYKVYRGTAAGSAPAESFESLVSPYTPLPTYRDLPTDLLSDYDYKVSSVSRLYRAGDSTPIVSESVATEPVRVAFGGVTVKVNDAAGFGGEDVDVFVSINNTMGLTGENLMLSLSYDPAVLTPKAVRTTGLTEGLVPQSFVEEGVWDILTVAGDITPGEGRVFVLTFTASAVKDTVKVPVTITQATLRLKDDKASAARVTYVDGVVELTVRPVPPSDPVPDEPVVEPGDPTVVAPWSLGDLNGDGRLTKEDRQLLAQLMQGNASHVTARHLRAGDYNGNGRLDNGDYLLLTEDFRSRGIIR